MLGGYWPSEFDPKWVPSEMNRLIPFFLEAAARSSGTDAHHLGLYNLCMFKDPRIPEFLMREKATSKPPAHELDRPGSMPFAPAAKPGIVASRVPI